MVENDIAAAERLSAESFYDLDLRTFQRDWPEPSMRGPDRREGWVARTTAFLANDGEGCWVAEDDSGMLGFATSFVRDKTWCLATYAVRPQAQGQGLGRQLLEAALSHGRRRGCLRGMLAASADPKAFRRYHACGFVMHPQMFLSGRVPREVLPVVEAVRDGSAADLDLMSSVDRQTRGAAHAPSDHAVLQRTCRLIVADGPHGSGYHYVDAVGTSHLLAATSRRVATDLLWEGLAASSPDQDVMVFHVTAANSWAVDVGIEAKLDVHTSGYLGLRGMRPPTPYLHNGALL